MKEASEVTILKAFRRAQRNLRKDKKMLASACSAGFLRGRGRPGKCNGIETSARFQVFVKICRYDPDLLKKNPESGGLLEFA